MVKKGMIFPSGPVAITSTSKRYRCVSTHTGDKLKDYNAHQGNVTSFTVNPSRDLIVSSCDQGFIKCVALKTGGEYWSDKHIGGDVVRLNRNKMRKSR